VWRLMSKGRIVVKNLLLVIMRGEQVDKVTGEIADDKTIWIR
jgi:hypothetical protein